MYELGYLRLDDRVSVDLQTGDLVDSYTALNPDWGNRATKPADDSAILTIAYDDPESLEAEAWVKFFNRQLAAPRNPHASKTPLEQEEWRAKIIKEYKLEPDRYSRRNLRGSKS